VAPRPESRAGIAEHFAPVGPTCRGDSVFAIPASRTSSAFAASEFFDEIEHVSDDIRTLIASHGRICPAGCARRNQRRRYEQNGAIFCR
jgi:hypothetical protein